VFRSSSRGRCNRTPPVGGWSQGFPCCCQTRRVNRRLSAHSSVCGARSLRAAYASKPCTPKSPPAQPPARRSHRRIVRAKNRRLWAAASRRRRLLARRRLRPWCRGQTTHLRRGPRPPSHRRPGRRSRPPGRRLAPQVEAAGGRRTSRSAQHPRAEGRLRCRRQHPKVGEKSGRQACTQLSSAGHHPPPATGPRPRGRTTLAASFRTARRRPSAHPRPLRPITPAGPTASALRAGLPNSGLQ